MRLVRRPFGYDLAGRVLRREANALRWAAEQALTGRSIASLARDLNARGILSSTGAQWRASSLIKVLRNPRYAGIATYHGIPVATAAWTPILTMEAHQQLVAELDEPARRIAADPVRKHLLSRLATCGICGERLGVNSDGRTGRRIYRCPRLHLSRRLDKVDAVVVDAVLNRLRLDGALALPGHPDVAGTRDRGSLSREMARIRTRIAQATAAFSAGDLDAAQLAAITRHGRHALAELDSDYAHALRAPALAALLAASGRSRPDRSLPAAWTRLTHQQRRDVVTTLVQVTVLPAGPGRHFEPGQVRLQWRT